MTQQPALPERNKHAWDTLYGKTEGLVWGEEPIGFIADYVQRLAPQLAPTARVLDAGTGEGRNLRALMQLGVRLDACDASENALSKIPAALREHIECKVVDLARLPYADETFDLILLADVAETLPNLPDVLADLRRILKPGGRLLCNIPDHDDEIAEVEMTPAEQDGYMYKDAFFFRFYPVEEARALLEDAGLTIESVEMWKWVEGSHGDYRDEEHDHTSQVYLTRR